MRRVVALVEIDGEEREMVFLTNNLEWSPRSVADLYRCRWQIEVFFKQIKQTLQLADFLGHNANAVRWQVWTALLVYVLLRYLSYLSKWAHSFTRLFTILRAVLWAETRPAGFAGVLWDSQAAASATWRDRNKRISPDSYEPMGQHSHRNRPCQSKKPNPKKSKSHFTPKAHETLENQAAKPELFTLWDASGLSYTTIIELATLAGRRGSALDRYA